jgi:hypothetical protein
MLDKAIRELDRERMGLQTQEKKVIAEIKKMAKEGQMVRMSPTTTQRKCIASSRRFTSMLSDAAGSCQGNGEVTSQEQARSDKALRAQVSAAGSIAKNSGKQRSNTALFDMPVLVTCMHAAWCSFCCNKCSSSDQLYSMQTLKSTQAMADAMKGATKVCSATDTSVKPVHSCCFSCSMSAEAVNPQAGNPC